MAYPVMPSPGDITIASRTSNGVICSVPAGRVFCYDINITNSINAIGSATTTVTTSGGGVGVDPPTPVVLLNCVVQGTALTTAASNTAYITGVIRAGDADVDLTFALGGAAAAAVTISGYLL